LTFFSYRPAVHFNQVENICITFAMTTFISLQDNARVEKGEMGSRHMVCKVNQFVVLSLCVLVK